MQQKSATPALVMSIVGIALSIISGWFIPTNIGAESPLEVVTTISSVIILILNVAGIVLSIMGTVNAAKAKKEIKAANLPTGVATAALVIGIIGIVIGGLTFFTCTMCTVLCACGTESAKGAL